MAAQPTPTMRVVGEPVVFPYGDVATDDSVRMRDLVWYEGPLVTQFTLPDGDSLIFWWNDSDDRSHRWFIFRLAAAQADDLVERRITIRDAMDSASEWWLQDRDGETVHATYRITMADLTADNIPDEGNLLEIMVCKS